MLKRLPPPFEKQTFWGNCRKCSLWDDGWSTSR